MKKCKVLFVFVVFLSTATISAQDNWKFLLNGKDFKFFEQLNGSAKYEIKNNELIPTSKLATLNTFMATIVQDTHTGEFH
jgi:hypothetical protein